MKRSARLCFHNCPSRGVFEGKMFEEKKNYFLIYSKVKRIAALSRMLIDRSDFWKILFD